jgi:hypothetical protein
MREADVTRGIGVLPVFARLIGLLLLVGSLAATWAREGRSTDRFRRLRRETRLATKSRAHDSVLGRELVNTPVDGLPQSVAGLIVRQLNCLNVGQTPAQCRRDDQNYGDHTEIS